MLAMDLHERGHHRRQARDRHCLVVDARDGAAAGVELANADHRLRIPIEERFDPRKVRAGTNQRRVGAAAEHQRQRVDEQGLAGAGLARDDRKAGPQWDADTLDER